MVFQRFNLFPHMTALENIMEAPIQVKGEKKSAVRERALALLDQVGLKRQARRPTRPSSPAASSSASPSPAPWRCSPSSCSSTSRPRRWTPSSSARCSR